MRGIGLALQGRAADLRLGAGQLRARHRVFRRAKWRKVKPNDQEGVGGMGPSPEALERLFYPSTVAVVGASPTNKWCRQTLANLVTLGYPGKIATVNPKYDEILGFPCAPSLRKLPFTPDVVVVSVNHNLVPAVIEDAADLGVKAAVVFAIGFVETGDVDGRTRQDRVVEAARKGGMALIGPNCQGLINFVGRTPLYIEAVQPYASGRVALISQSGSMATTLLNNRRGVRWSHAVSVGNEAVTDSADLVGFFAEDDATDVIALFMETVRSSDRFHAQCERARERGKPVVVLKTGRTAASVAAAMAHSGALAVEDRLVDALFQRHGVARVASMEELLETCIAMQARRKPKGGRLATITESGGHMELVLDEADTVALEHPPFAPETLATVLPHFPGLQDVRNPLDTEGIADFETSYPKVMEAVVADPGIDALVTLSDFTYSPTGGERGQLAYLEEIAATTDKPVVVIGTVDGIVPPDVVRDLARKNIVALSGMSEGLHALAHLVAGSQATMPRAPGHDIAAERVRGALLAMSGPTAGMPAMDAIAAAGIRVAESGTALDEDSAAMLAAGIGYPVVMKPGDPALVHKTEMGTVFSNVANERAARRCARDILASSEAILVQEQIRSGVELIVGLQSDRHLGTFVIVGMGGVWTELIDDAVVRPVGLRVGEAESMVRSLRGFRMLDGARGGVRTDLSAIVDAIERVDTIGREFGPQLEAIDINPIIAGPEHATAVDALVIPRW
jgi:acetyltransferase